MSTIEDKILNGPQVHYCEADNDDIRIDEEADENVNETDNGRHDVGSLFQRPDEETEKSQRLSQVRLRNGGSTNTGPKGVIEDFRKRSMSGEPPAMDDLEAEFQALLNDDSILKEYVAKRMSDAVSAQTPTFGQVFRLQTGAQLLDAIDRENPNVLVIVHIYSKFSRSCANLNRCLDELAKELKQIKFVTLDSGVTQLSANFKQNGVPALLAYKKGDLIKSLVQLEELLDKDFDASQLSELLKDNGLII